MVAAKQIQIVFDAQSNPQLRADPDDLELVWVNLLDNAVRHSAMGGKITLGLREYPLGEAAICVKDSGDGISHADLPYVFERFRRGGESRGQLSNGYGLGLAICKAIVEAYQGRIDIKSEPGKGASVLVQIPLESHGNTY
jgi:signal transduction histidine kinase